MQPLSASGKIIEYISIILVNWRELIRGKVKFDEIFRSASSA